MVDRLLWVFFVVLLVDVPRIYCGENNCIANSKKSSLQVGKHVCKKGATAYGDFCLHVCPSGYYHDDTRCIPCHTPCATCRSDSQCTSCNNLFLTPDGLCMKECQTPLLAKNTSSPRIRLFQGSSSLEGRVEVYYNGSWGTVCDDGWDRNAARVVCNELNLGSVVEVNVDQERFKSSDGYKNDQIWLSEIKCKGNETSITQCVHKEWGMNECSHYEDVGIRCSGPDKSKMCVKSCGDGYYAEKDQCLECPLDCETCDGPKNCIKCVETRFLEGSITNWITSYRSITNWITSYRSQCVSRCSPHYYGDPASRSCVLCPKECLTCVRETCTSCAVGLFLKGAKCVIDCGTSLSSSPYLRLSGNYSSPYEGLLEVRYHGAWHSVCNDLFGWTDARVFCRELGYGDPVTYDYGEHGESVGDVLVDDIHCMGYEKSFVECTQRRWFDSDCSHSEDIGLSCSAPVISFGSWGSCVDKCRDGMFKSKANTCELCNGACVTCTTSSDKCTACREPYYLNGTECSLGCPVGQYPNASRRACLPCDASRRGCLTCEGSPDHCLSCVLSMYHNGTKCLPSCTANMYRKGRKCVHDCGVMHYANATSHECHACPVNCHTCVVRNAVVCVACAMGYALNVSENCVRNCPHGYVFAPIDPKAVNIHPVVRLVNLAGSRFYGRLEVLHDGVWGTVCDDNWSLENEEVICRELLLGTPNASYIGFESLNASKFWLDDVICNGDEESIVQCKHDGWGNDNCADSESVYLRCNGPGVSTCQKQCPSGYFATAGFCEPCADGCASCLKFANNCSKCAKDLHLSKTGTCIDRCPQGQYATADHRCNECNSSCTTCKGSSENCISCRSPYFISGDRCVLNCSQGKFRRSKHSKISLRYINGRIGGVVTVARYGQQGLACGWFLSSKTANVICKQLNMGKASSIFSRSLRFTSPYRHMPILLKQPYCHGNESSLFDCNSFTSERPQECTHSNIISVVCAGPNTRRACLDSCPTDNGYFVTSENVCEPCSVNCRKCAGNATNCTTCSEGMFKTWHNKCVHFCVEGTYYDDEKKMCLQCNSLSCLACSGTKDKCNDCRDGKYVLDSTSCHETCKKLRKIYEKVGTKEMRLFGGINASFGRVEILQKGSWATICGNDWDIRGAAVVCRQLGFGDAIKSYSEYYFRSGRARIVLPPKKCDGTELDLLLCDNGTAECTGRRYAGVMCSRATPKRECVNSCGTGYFLYATDPNFLYATDTKCLPCSSNCLDCFGLADKCTACDDSSFLLSSNCARSCPEGYYGNLRSKRCERCHPTCRTCIDGWTNNYCSSCVKPYFLKNTKCVDDCNLDYSLKYLLDDPNALVVPARIDRNIRLLNGPDKYEGQLEVLREGIWGRVCTLTSFQANLVCQQLGYEGGSSEPDRFPPNDSMIPLTWSIYCNDYESVLAKCRFTNRGDLCGVRSRNSWVVCSRKPLDTNVCRKTKARMCRAGACYRRARCVDGDGTIVEKGKSFCIHCPKGFIGDGDNCTALSLFPPIPRVTSRNYTMIVGKSARLYCYGMSGIVAVFPDRYSWRKDGKLRRGNRGFFSIPHAHHSDKGIYTCTLRNSVGFVTITYGVIVVGPPQITSALNVNAVLGSNVLLNCKVASNPPATIKWYYNNSVIVARGQHHGPKPLGNGSLEIIEALQSNAGSYICEARNQYAGSNATITFRVTDEVHFNKGLKNLELDKGQTARFQCNPLSSSSSATIAWRKNGKALEINKRISVINQHVLVISKVSQEDCGEYFCVVRNNGSIVTSFGTLAIKGEPPCIHTPPLHLSLQVGMDARFYCQASGAPKPVYTWENRKSQIPSYIYEIKNVSIADVGVYICRARSGNKEAKAYAFLTVGGRHACPIITHKPANKKFKLGGQAIFRCEGDADPWYVIVWYHGDKELKNSSRISITDRNQTVVIHNMRSSDEGQYTCVVQSLYGQQKATALLSTDGDKLGRHGTKSSPNTVSIVLGVVLSLLILFTIAYFVWRYRRDGSSPSDIVLDMKRKAALRFRGGIRPVILRYDSEHVCHEDDGLDTSDTNPFVRD